MTNPDELDKAYHISKNKRPGGLMVKFIDALPLNLKPDTDYSYFRSAYELSGYGMNIGIVIKNLFEKDINRDYYIERHKSKDKRILSIDEYETALFCKKELINNPTTKDYFTGKKIVKFQVPIYWNWSTWGNNPNVSMMNSKGMLDMLVIDPEEKSLQVIDLKTITKSASTFPNSFVAYGYYIQAYFYWYAVQELIAGRGVSPAFSSTQLEQLKEYTVKPPLFIVVPKVEGSRALVYSLSDNDMQALYLGTSSFEGVKSLLNRWQFHNASGEWEFPMEVYKNKGTVPLKIASFTKPYDL